MKANKKTLLASAISLAVVGTANAEFQLEEVVVTATRRAESVQDVPYNISAVQGGDLAAAGITDVAALAARIPGVSYTDRGARGGAFNSGIAMRGLSTEDGRLSGPLGTAPAVGTYVNETPLYVNLRLTDIERVEVLRGPQGTLYGSGSMGGTMRFIQAKPSMEGFESEVSADISQTKNGDGINHSAEAMFNIPVSDNFALRMNVGQSEDAGWIDRPRSYVLRPDGEPVSTDESNRAPGVIVSTKDFSSYTPSPVYVSGNRGAEPIYQSEEGTNEENSTTARISALWQPNDEFEAHLNYQYQKDESKGNPIQAADHPDYGEYDSPSLIEEPFESETEVLSLDMSYDLGFASVTASLSHYDTEQEFSGETTERYTNFSFYPYTYGLMPRPLVTYEDTNNDEAKVLEVRLNSQTDGDFDWVIGMFHMDQDTQISDDQSFPGYQDWADACGAANPDETATPPTPATTYACGAGTTLGTFMSPYANGAFYTSGPQAHPNADAAGIEVVKDRIFVSSAESNFTDTAVFGELTWHASEEWQITGGFRSFKQEFETTAVNAAILVDSVDKSSRSFDNDDTLFKFNTSYDVNEETMVYFTWSEGFRRGGANPLPLTLLSFGTPYETHPASLDYEPDTVTNIEVGIKGSIDERFTYTLSYFDIDWENIQLNTSTTIFAYPTVLNMGDAETSGVEFEFAGQLTENLHITMGYSYTDAKLTDPDNLGAELAIGDPYSYTTVAGADAAAATGASAAVLKGARLPGVARNTMSLDLEYTQNLDNGMSVVYDINGTYRDETQGELDPTLATTADGFQMWNAYVLLDSGDAWTARLYVDNLFDEIGVINTANLPENGPRRSQIISKPRTIGLGMSYRF